MTNDPNVPTEQSRDRFSLTKEQLLADYAAISKKRSGSAEATALRLRSRQFLDIMSFEASLGVLNWRELRKALLDPPLLSSLELEPMLMAQIGRVLLLQQLEPDDSKLAVAALEYGVAGLPNNFRSRKFRKLLVEHYILAHQYAKSRSLLDAWRDVDREFHKYLRAELDNPFFVREEGDMGKWLSNFNREFKAHGLAPIRLVGDTGAPFDLLATEEPTPAPIWHDADEAPKVSVIVTTFQPGLAELFTAVRSILDQTYPNIEVVVVDDASGSEFEETIAAVGSMDDRVRIVRAEENGGTYVARNIGLAAATGYYATGQDDDDWSHPERIAEQVSLLHQNPDVLGCRVASLNCMANLSRVRFGYKPMTGNASSLMMKRETFELVGGFMPARKAADTELRRRAEEVTGRRVIDIEKPLAIIRIDVDSLSRGEFRAGWSHPARREYQSSYAYWHTHAPKSELSLAATDLPPVNIPRRFRINKEEFPSRFDVIFAGDWLQYGGPQKSMIEEIRALTSRGLKIGVMQLEAARFMAKRQRPLVPHIQELINDGTVYSVLYDDPVEVDLLILRYPPILQFAPAERSALQVRRMMILANQAPSEMDGSDIRYLVGDCTDNAREVFCKDVIWAPQGPQVRAAIAPYLADNEITPSDVPGVVDPGEWFRDHSRRRSTLPVVGRHSRDNAMKWPEDASIIEMVYPTSGRFDVRILGGAKVAGRVLGDEVAPAGWTVYETDALPVQTFLETLDFYVFYQNSIAVEAFGRSVLEAIASGLVVILPAHYRQVFGEAALYAEPATLQALVMNYHNDRDLYMRQVRVAQKIVDDHFSHDAHGRLIAGFLEEVSR